MIRDFTFRGERMNMFARAIQVTSRHVEHPDTFPQAEGFAVGPSKISGRLVYMGFEDCPVLEGDWIVNHGPLNAPVTFHFDAATFDAIYRPVSVDPPAPAAKFIDFGAGLERDARRCLVVLVGLVVIAVGVGMGIYHLAFGK